MILGSTVHTQAVQYIQQSLPFAPLAVVNDTQIQTNCNWDRQDQQQVQVQLISPSQLEGLHAVMDVA